MNCPLCELEKKTDWHYPADGLMSEHDDSFVVIDCQTCEKTPMWIQLEHGDCVEEVREAARAWCREKWGDIDFRGPRKIENHYHEHVLKTNKH